MVAYIPTLSNIKLLHLRALHLRAYVGAFAPAGVVGAVCRAISIKEQSRLGVEHCGT